MKGVFKSSTRFAALVVLAAAANSAYAINYEITSLVRPGADSISLFGVNNAGQMVGSSNSSTFSPSDAFVYFNGTFTSLTGPAASVSTHAMGINDLGTIVGDFATTTASDGSGGTIYGDVQSFIFDGSAYHTFVVPGAVNTYARAISADGRYVSGYYDSNTISRQGFLLDTVTNTFSFLGAGGSTSLTIAQGINSSGLLVGNEVSLNVPSPNRPGFTYNINTGVRSDFYLPGVVGTTFRDIDDNGIISGWYRDANFVDHGFTGFPGDFQTIDVAGADFSFVEGSNNSRLLVGNFDIGETYSGAFIARPISEPAMLMVFAVGLFGLMITRRRGITSRQV